MIKELISEDELSDIESTNETHKRKTNEDVVSHRRARRNKSKNRHTRKGKTKKTKKKNKKTNHNYSGNPLSLLLVYPKN